MGLDWFSNYRNPEKTKSTPVTAINYNMLKTREWICKFFCSAYGFTKEEIDTLTAHLFAYKQKHQLLNTISGLLIELSKKGWNEKFFPIIKDEILKTIESNKNENFLTSHITNLISLIDEGFSDDEIKKILEASTEYNGQESFIKWIYEQIHAKILGKSDILDAIELISPDMIKAQQDYVERVGNPIYPKMHTLFSYARNIQQLKKSWLTIETIGKLLEHSNSNKNSNDNKNKYFFKILSILKSKTLKDLNITNDDITNTVEFLHSNPHPSKYEKFNEHLSSCNPSCVFNYIIIKKLGKEKIRQFIKSNNKDVSSYFPDTEFIKVDTPDFIEKMLYELIRIAHKEIAEEAKKTHSVKPKPQPGTPTSTHKDKPDYLQQLEYLKKLLKKEA